MSASDDCIQLKKLAAELRGLGLITEEQLRMMQRSARQVWSVHLMLQRNQAASRIRVRGVPIASVRTTD